MSKHLAPKLKADLLIVDDTPENLRLLNQILSAEYKVRLAPSGEKGLDAARSIPPDLILLDVMMPGLNGYEVAARLKAWEQTRDIPIIFISALDDTESKLRGFTAGGVDYITKPFHEQEVLARVKTHLSIHNLTRQLQTELAERKRVEELLRQREHDFSTLVENATDMIVRFDTDLRHIYCNPAVERQLGIPPSVVLGKSFLELGPESDQSRLAYQALQQALETGLEQEYERTFPLPSGMKYFQTRIVPERSADGRIESILAITRDMTERRRAEEALRESEERYRLITQNAEDIIWTVDMNLRPTYASPSFEQAVGYSADEREKFTPENLLTPESLDAGLKAFAEEFAVASSIPDPNYSRVLEMEYYRKDGSTFLVEMKFSFFRNAEGQPTGVLGVGRDITKRKEMEDALRASEARLGAIVNHSLDGILTHKNGVVVFANPALARIVGIENPLDLVGSYITDLVAPENREMIVEYTRRRLGGENVPGSYETIAQSRDGKPLPVELNVSTYWLNGDLYTLAIVRDITERKHAEEALRASNTKLETLIQVSPLAILLLDASGNIQMWNLAAEQIFGWAAQEIIGHPNPIVQTGRQDEYASLSAQIMRGKPVASFETVRQRKDGTLIDVGISSASIKDADGNITGRMAIIADITERKRMEQSLLQRTREMATLYETSLEINALSDLFMLLNAIIRRACALLDIPFGALWLMQAEEGMLELVVGHQIPAHWIGTKIRPGEGLAGQVVQTRAPVVINDYQTWNARVEAFNDTPAHRTLAVPLKVHEDVIGVIVLFDRQVGAFSDEEVRLISLFAGQAAIAISNAQFAGQLEERVQQRTDELELVAKELESISYTVSHDLRTPLRAIIGYARMIQDEQAVGITPEGIRMLGLIRENAQVMGKMVDGLLSFMRLNRKTLNVQTINMDLLVRQALNSLGTEQTGRKIKIKICNMPPCKGDRELLFSVWHSLLSNALKFSRSRKVACIEVGCLDGEKDQPVFYVRDNGVGFDMRYSDKLFKVFHRLHHTQEFEGIGMGLALVQRVILRHGGRIWPEAQEDKGATFFFTLGAR